MRYGIILSDEMEGLNLNSADADDVADRVELEDYMTNFSIDEYNDGNGSYSTILVLTGELKEEVLNDIGLRGIKSEIKDLEYVDNIVEMD